MLPPVYPRSPQLYNFQAGIPKSSYVDSYSYNTKCTPQNIRSAEFPRSILEFNNTSEMSMYAKQRIKMDQDLNLTLDQNYANSSGFSPVQLKPMKDEQHRMKQVHQSQFQFNKENQQKSVKEGADKQKQRSLFPQIRYNSQENQRSILQKQLSPEQSIQKIYQFQEIPTHKIKHRQKLESLPQQENEYHQKRMIKKSLTSSELHQLLANTSESIGQSIHQTKQRIIAKNKNESSFEKSYQSLQFLNPDQELRPVKEFKMQYPSRNDTISRKVCQGSTSLKRSGQFEDAKSNFTSLLQEHNKLLNLKQKRSTLQLEQESIKLLDLQKQYQGKNGQKKTQSIMSTDIQMSTDSDGTPHNSTKIHIVKKKKKKLTPQVNMAPQLSKQYESQKPKDIQIVSDQVKEKQNLQGSLLKPLQISTRKEDLQAVDDKVKAMPITPLQPKSALKKQSTMKPSSNLLTIKSPDTFERKVSFGKNHTKQYVVDDSFTSMDE